MKGLTKLKESFNRSIQVKLTSYFIVILLPLICFSLYANSRSRSILEQELGERTMSAMSSALEYVDLTMDGMKNLSTLLSTDSGLTSRLKYTGDLLSAEALVDFTQVMLQLTNIANVNPGLSGVTIYHGGSGRLLSSRIGALHRPEAVTEPWFDEVMRAGGSYILYVPDKHEEALMGWADPVYDEEQIVLMQLMDLYSRERDGNVLMLSLPKRQLLGYLMNLTPSDASKVFLYDNSGRLIVSNTSGPHNPGEKDLVLRAESRRSGWSLELMQPEGEIYRKSQPLQLFTYWIIVISCLLAVWISWLIYSSIASPISSLVSGMKQLRRGNFDARLEHNRQDELGYLTDAFNQTVEQQRHLIQDIYEQQLRLTKTELKFLQSQINPHFLYNTLDSIYWSAKNYEADEISEMVLNLSRFFRLSLSKGRDTFTVEENFAHLRYYIRVQQLRFVDQFSAGFHAAPDTGGLYVLKLLLQPLAENAILHGLEKRESGGELRIAAERKGDRLVLMVADNGRGIPAQRLERIREALSRNAGMGGGESGGEFFGLLNVKSRIKLYYGEEAEFTIESEEGAGTVSRIALPAERCVNQG
ncbi:sensor histidine kinase [Paenibacillus sp. S150]|uniref:cache domain-containing sensor histidine kinase n=1 Tax=Paenibacillus sp. S150 TaxID=2749826 RepID=UPI001C55AB81|nr:sensor histidine kinase [Paenibacillus sp. S150]MBW4085596.1 sensor histidine kinase [Paenibacillus sp. S150]